MDLQQFITDFAKTLEIEKTETLSGETRFRDLDQWSSIVYLSVLEMIGEKYKVQIKTKDFRLLNTLSEISAAIESARKH
ncbi:phosphopantetheine-binding protein [uncultured Bacteroides sp.]|uniref:phosphopantetheine-binding protein n=1 Tax=uncultured Bacteroides sp. TaxID=162156 RepID=UPI002AAB74B3|nr:phosphopantetheine-binding protein [uncultured Bacteroides sp.]